MKIFTIAILLALFAAITLAQGVADLQSSDAGKRALAYFVAFNSGDDAQLAGFFRDNTDDEALKRRGVEPRAAFHKQVRGDFKTLTLKKVASVSPQQIRVLAQGATGEWAALTFEIEPSGKFGGVSVERIEPPSAAVEMPAAPATMAEFMPAVGRLMDGLVRSNAFSGVVMVAKDDRPIFSHAYGSANTDSKAANNLETRFNLGSINKIFTRIAIGQLVAAGKLSFSDKLSKVLPNYPNRAIADKITIGQIVTMRSGLGDFFNDRFRAADKSRIRTLQDWVPLFADDPLEFEPGAKSRYSNAGYLVLGLVIEKLSGMSYYDYVDKNLFKPAGMTSTGSYAIDDLPANTAIGYKAAMSPARQPNTAELPARGSSAGGGYSTVADMLRFAGALRSRKLIVPDDNGALPAEFSGTGVAGGSPGVNALFITNAKTGYTITVLSNLDPPSAEKPGATIKDWLQQIKQ